MSTRRGARRVVAATIVATAAWLVPMTAGSAAAAPADPCPGGALTTVYDDAGVVHDACVAVAAADVPVQLEAAPAVPERAPADSSLPSTGANATLLVLAGALVAAGSAAQLAARRRS